MDGSLDDNLYLKKCFFILEKESFEFFIFTKVLMSFLSPFQTGWLCQSQRDEKESRLASQPSQRFFNDIL